MADTKKISQPSQGSEDLGKETRDRRDTGRPSAGTDTQTRIAAKGGKKTSDKKDIHDDEKVVKNAYNKKGFADK